MDGENGWKERKKKRPDGKEGRGGIYRMGMGGIEAQVSK